MNKVSIVIPCYCSEKSLPQVVERISNVMGREDYELILVNDASPDNTFAVITELAQKDNRIIGINLARNFGQHSAIFAGFHYASGDEIVCLDDDGQTPPEEFPHCSKQFVEKQMLLMRDISTSNTLYFEILVVK